MPNVSNKRKGEAAHVGCRWRHEAAFGDINKGSHIPIICWVGDHGDKGRSRPAGARRGAKRVAKCPQHLRGERGKMICLLRRWRKRSCRYWKRMAFRRQAGHSDARLRKKWLRIWGISTSAGLRTPVSDFSFG